MDRFSWVWLVIVGIGMFSMVRPGGVKLFQRRGTLAKMSDYYETPERKRIALRIERFERWYFIINGACLVLAGLSLRFVSVNAFAVFIGLTGLLGLIGLIYNARVFSSK
jgi:hypothetical protein